MRMEDTDDSKKRIGEEPLEFIALILFKWLHLYAKGELVH